MKKTRILSWLLLLTLTLSACGGRPAAGAGSSDASPADDSAASLPPAQSAMQPLPELPDASDPAASLPDGSVQEPDAVQAPDASQPPEAPPAAVSKPQVTKPQVTSKPKTQPEPETPDTSGEVCELPPAPAGDDPPADPEPKSAPTKADAQAYIGKSVSSLIAAIGAPKGTDYAPSCMGDGEDGELFYDGFTVYTYRANGTETVQDVV